MSEMEKYDIDLNNIATMKGVLDAISALPGVAERVEAYMMGAGVEDPHCEIQALIDEVSK